MTDSSSDEDKLKRVEFYSAGVTAWYNSAFEHDKSILTLSASGIALLVTLLTTVGAHSSESVVLYILAMFFFLVSLGSILAVFNRNKAHIEQVFSGNSAPDPFLTVFDKVAVISFSAGVLLSSIIGISSAINVQKPKENCMANESKPVTNTVRAFDSVNGIANMSPTQVIKESVNNVGALKPQPAPTATPPATPSVTNKSQE